LQFPIRGHLLEAQIVAQKALANREISKSVFLNGTIDSLRVGGMTLNERGIAAVILAKGAVSVLVHD